MPIHRLFPGKGNPDEDDQENSDSTEHPHPNVHLFDLNDPDARQRVAKKYDDALGLGDELSGPLEGFLADAASIFRRRGTDK